MTPTPRAPCANHALGRLRRRLRINLGAVQQKDQGELGTPLEVYVQPTEFKTSFILGKLGISANGLPEDFIFTNTQKLLLPSFALLMYRIYVSPMLNSTSAKRTSSVKQKRR